MSGRRHASGLLLLGACALAGCHLTEFDDTVKGTTTVQGSPLGAVLGAFPNLSGLTHFDFSQTQDFQNQGVSKRDVDSVKLKSLTLKIVSPTAQDFGFLDSIQLYAEANGQKALVAQKLNIGSLGLKAPNPVLSLDVLDVELKPFVTADAMSITTQATGRQPPQDTQIEATAVFHVKVL